MQNGMLFLQLQQTSSVSLKTVSQYGHRDVGSSSSVLSGFLKIISQTTGQDHTLIFHTLLFILPYFLSVNGKDITLLIFFTISNGIRHVDRHASTTVMS